jgi:NAD(P)-dependent dehydrogenase (short-subunit alcohol dehydrogenase family)
VATALSTTHDVLLGGRDVAALEQASARLSGSRPWPVELTDPDALTSATSGIDRLAVLVHCAGTVELGPVAETPATVWRQQMEVNLVAVAELTRLLLPALRTARGHVVLINSGAGLRANPGWGAYAASKFALRAFGDVLRAEEPDLRVTSVHPGRIDTPIAARGAGRRGWRLRAGALPASRLGRRGRAGRGHRAARRTPHRRRAPARRAALNARRPDRRRRARSVRAPRSPAGPGR